MKEKTSDSITGWGIIGAIIFVIFAMASCNSCSSTSKVSPYPAPMEIENNEETALGIARNRISIILRGAEFWEGDDHHISRIDDSRYKVIGIARMMNKRAGYEAIPFEIWVAIDQEAGTGHAEWYHIQGVGTGYLDILTR